MKKFIVKIADKKYKVEANTYDEAIRIIKLIDANYDKPVAKIISQYAIVKRSEWMRQGMNAIAEMEAEVLSAAKRTKNMLQLRNKVEYVIVNTKTRKIEDALKDNASELDVVNALLEDERAAVAAYNIALENLKGKIPDESYAVIEVIRNDENRHIENLQAVVNGTVTEKNLEDSIKDDYFWSEIKPGEHVYIEYRDAGRRLATLPNKTVFKGYEGGMIVVSMNGKELRIPENTIAVRTKDSVKDIDVEYAADLAEDLASLLRRAKITQAKKVLQILVQQMK